jgi:hypothetical protein
MAVSKHYISEVRVRRLARSSRDLSSPNILQEDREEVFEMPPDQRHILRCHSTVPANPSENAA